MKRMKKEYTPLLRRLLILVNMKEKLMRKQIPETDMELQSLKTDRYTKGSGKMTCSTGKDSEYLSTETITSVITSKIKW